jgi:uncharacterized membrane-anchored protein YitT (DUF2179 family)
MKLLVNKILEEFIRRRFIMLGERIPSSYRVAKELYLFRITLSHLIKSIFLITIGIFSAAVGLKSFLLPNGFIDGGVTGISMLSSHVTGVSLSVFIVLINLPFLYLGYRQINKGLAFKSIFAISGLAIVVALMDFPVITTDKLLTAAFGGFFLGGGIGMAIRGGAVLDGTEILAITISRNTGLTIGDVILLFNIMIFSVAAYLLTMEAALYSILTYLAASRTVDFVIEGVEEYTGVTIVSSHSEEIRIMIIEKMGRGVTVYTGKRGYGKRGENRGDVDIVFTVITRLEIGKLQSEVEKIDPNAFLVMHSIKDTRGGMIKKRPLKH